MTYVVLVLLGVVPLTLGGLALAGLIQLGSAELLDRSLERRDSKRHDRDGWPERSSFPVVGAPDFSEKLEALRRRR